MKRVASFAAAVAAALLAVGCARDRSGSAPEQKPVTDEAPGAGVVSANELGPQSKRFVPVTTSSNDARAVFERGRELQENIRHREAAEKFEKAIELDPEFALAHAYLAFVTPDRDASKQHFAKAMDLADRLDAPERLVIEGMRARKQGDRVEERRLYEELSKLAPKDWRVAMWMGESANRLGDIDGAIKAFELSISLNPEAAEPYNTLSYVHAMRGDYDDAVKAAKRYAELKPSEPNPRDTLGEILMMAGRYEEAEQAFRDAVEVAPSFAIAVEGAALTHCYREQWDEAVELWKKASELSAPAGQYDMQEQLAYTYLASGKSRQALAQVDAIEKLAQKHELPGFATRARLTRAALLQASGNYKAARRELNKLIDGIDEGAEPGVRHAALVRRAWVEVESGKTAQAKKTLEEIEALAKANDPKYSPGLHFARGAVALSSGDAKTAIEHLEKLESVGDIEKSNDPFILTGQSLLADALEKLGKRDKARELRDKAASSYRRSAAWVAERKLRFRSDS